MGVTPSILARRQVLLPSLSKQTSVPIKEAEVDSFNQLVNPNTQWPSIRT